MVPPPLQNTGLFDIWMKWFSQYLTRRISANPTKNKPKLETLSEKKTWTGLETVECGHPPATGSQEFPPGTQDSQAGLAMTRPTEVPVAAPGTLTRLTCVGGGVGGAVLHGTWAPAQCSLQHWLLWAEPHSVGNKSISCHQEENCQHKDCAGMARHQSLCHTLLAAGPQRLRGPKRVPTAGR